MLRAALGLLVLTLALRAETFFHPLILPTDEGLYFRIAYQWLCEHTPLYAGSYDHKPPGIYYIYALLMKLGGPTMLSIRWGVVAACWAAALLLYGFAKRLAPARAEMAGWGAGLAYAILSLRMTGLNGNLEVFFNPLIIATLWLVWEAVQEDARRPSLKLLAAGVLGGMVFMIKYTCGAEMAALPALWLVWMGWRRWKAGKTVYADEARKQGTAAEASRVDPGPRPWAAKVSIVGAGDESGRESTHTNSQLLNSLTPKFLNSLLAFGLGFLLPIAAILAHFAVNGQGIAFLVDRTLVRNFTHKAGARSLYKPLAYSYYLGRILGEYALGWLGLAAFMATLRRWATPMSVLLLGWLLTASVSATFTGHLFDHYLIECLPPLCVLAGLVLGRVAFALPEPIPAGGLLLAFVFTPLGADEARRQWPNLLADIATARHGHHLWAGDGTYKLATYLNTTLQPGQTFFAVEGNPTLYVMSGRDIPSEYAYWPLLVSPHFAKVTSLNQAAEVDRILNLPPRLIVSKVPDVDELSNEANFPRDLTHRIQSRIQSQYALRDTVAGWYVFEKR